MKKNIIGGICGIFVGVLILLLMGCTSTNNTKLQDAEWSCSNTQLAEYERRGKDEYIKVRCKE